ncbi:MAG: hypothetical protein ACYCV7_12360, partial [Acidimicrobiales bacterium]
VQGSRSDPRTGASTVAGSVPSAQPSAQPSGGPSAQPSHSPAPAPALAPTAPRSPTTGDADDNPHEIDDDESDAMPSFDDSRPAEAVTVDNSPQARLMKAFPGAEEVL